MIDLPYCCTTFSFVCTAYVHVKKYVSSYEAYPSLKQGYPTMDYKNPHKRVKRLESLEFIEPVKAKEVKAEDAKNRAKYYRISEAGMFYLFFREGMGVSDMLSSMIAAHGNYLIFETLLYPCKSIIRVGARST